MKKFLFCLGLFLLFPAACLAVPPDLVGESIAEKDIGIFGEENVVELGGRYYLAGSRPGALAGSRRSGILASPDPWTQMGPYGFGDPDNIIIIPSTVYKKHLYFQVYSASPAGAQLFRVKGKSAPEAFGAPGFGNSNNAAMTTMRKIGDYLYIGIDGDPNGAQIWRTDGKSLTQVGHSGFGDANNFNPRFIGRIEGYYYLAFSNNVTGAQIWRSPDGEDWTKAIFGGFGNANNRNTYGNLKELDGHYYVSVHNNATGCEIWRTENGFDWEKVVDNGFGDATRPMCLIQVFNDHLISYFSDDAQGFYIMKTQNGTDWQSACPAGFGDPDNQWANPESFRQWLYVGTYNDSGPGQLWRTKDFNDWTRVYPYMPMSAADEQLNPMNANNNLFVLGLNAASGGRIWHYDGDRWTRWNSDGMDGNPENYNMFLATYRKYLLAISINYADGGGIWRQNFSGGSVSSLDIRKQTKNYVYLKWKVPKGKDLKRWIVKRYKEPITEDNWHRAKKVKKITKVKKAGKIQKTKLKTKRRRTYYFAVRSVNYQGMKSSISNVVPSIRKMQTKKIGKRTARLKWSPAEDTEKYIVQLRTKGGHKIRTWKNVSKKYRNVKEKFLSPGQEYKWRVRPVSWEGEKHDWSRYKRFTTKS